MEFARRKKEIKECFQHSFRSKERGSEVGCFVSLDEWTSPRLSDIGGAVRARYSKCLQCEGDQTWHDPIQRLRLQQRETRVGRLVLPET